MGRPRIRSTARGPFLGVGSHILPTYSSTTSFRIRSRISQSFGRRNRTQRITRYGPGTYNSIDATKMNDEILGRVMDKIHQLGWEQSTDIIITQDHNHSTVSGDVAHYPLRGIVDGDIGSHDPYGYSVSGFVRTAELLTRDG